MTEGSYVVSTIMQVLNEERFLVEANTSIRSQAYHCQIPIVLKKVIGRRRRIRLADSDLRKPDDIEEGREP